MDSGRLQAYLRLRKENIPVVKANNTLNLIESILTNQWKIGESQSTEDLPSLGSVLEFIASGEAIDSIVKGANSWNFNPHTKIRSFGEVYEKYGVSYLAQNILRGFMDKEKGEVLSNLYERWKKENSATPAVGFVGRVRRFFRKYLSPQFV